MTEFQRRQITVSRSNSDCTAKRMATATTNPFMRQYVERASFKKKKVKRQSNFKFRFVISAFLGGCHFLHLKASSVFYFSYLTNILSS